MHLLYVLSVISDDVAVNILYGSHAFRLMAVSVSTVELLQDVKFNSNATKYGQFLYHFLRPYTFSLSWQLVEYNVMLANA